jgi:hypothetical protein
MAFLTPEQIKAVRVKGSTKHELERLGKAVLIVHMSADAALEMRAFQKKMGTPDQVADSGAKTQRDLFVHMLTQAIATEDGELLGKADAELLLRTLNMGEVTRLIDAVNKLLSEALGDSGKAAGNPAAGGDATSSSVSA